MRFGPVIDELIEALRVLPGVGQKTAQRMALDLLERKREGGMRLSSALAQAMEHVKRCHTCRNLTEAESCALCSDSRRDDTILCVVESPSDLLAIELSQQFPGKYFVLSGSLSPIDGRGPDQVGIPLLIDQVNGRPIKELILATNPTVEGEATAHFISEIFREKDVLITRLAHGIPLGGELGFVDGGTLGHAFSGRKPV
jgi:recombination protein RecR